MSLPQKKKNQDEDVCDNGTRHNKHKNYHSRKRKKKMIPKIPSGHIEFDKWKCFGHRGELNKSLKRISLHT